MTKEIVDVFDEFNNFTGTKEELTKVHKNSLWHRTAHVWLYNSKKEILLQLRSNNMDFYPNLWDASSAGHINAGEEPIISALREIKEEIGLSVKKSNLDFIMIKKNKLKSKNIEIREFYYVYLLKFEGNPEKLKLQKQEVKKVKFFHINKLEQDLKLNPDKYLPHGDYWFQVIEKIKRKFKKS